MAILTEAAPAGPPDPIALLSHPPTSPALQSYISYLSTLAALEAPAMPDPKIYADAAYLNYYPLGLSLMFVPRPESAHHWGAGARWDDLEGRARDMVLDSVDVYNKPEGKGEEEVKGATTSSRAKNPPFAAYPALPLTLPLAPVTQSTSSPSTPPSTSNSSLTPASPALAPSTRAVDLVRALGEPGRKGGGAAGGIGIWCEWATPWGGLMVEFRGREAVGPQAWEMGKEARWRVATIFAGEAGEG